MNTSPDLTLATVKMVIALGVVLAVIWGLYRIARRSLPMAQAGGKGKMIQVLESQYLGVKKNITLVQVPGEVLVLGVGPDRVNLLTRIDNPEIIKSIADASASQRSFGSFKDHLQRLTRLKTPGASGARKADTTE